MPCHSDQWQYCTTVVTRGGGRSATQKIGTSGNMRICGTLMCFGRLWAWLGGGGGGQWRASRDTDSGYIVLIVSVVTSMCTDDPSYDTYGVTTRSHRRLEKKKKRRSKLKNIEYFESPSDGSESAALLVGPSQRLQGGVRGRASRCVHVRETRVLGSVGPGIQSKFAKGMVGVSHRNTVTFLKIKKKKKKYSTQPHSGQLRRFSPLLCLF